jgi:hypothetical protein
MATIEETTTRVYTINLGKAWITPEHKRTDRVVNMIKEEGGTVTVSLYEDLPAAATAAVETPTLEEKKDEEPKPSAEMTTNTEQSSEEGKTKSANK